MNVATFINRTKTNFNKKFHDPGDSLGRKFQLSGNFVDIMVKNANLIDLAGIKYLPCQFIPERANTLEKVGNLCINTDYFPRAFFVTDYIVASNADDALMKLKEILEKRKFNEI